MNYSDPKGSPGKEHHARLVQEKGKLLGKLEFLLPKL